MTCLTDDRLEALARGELSPDDALAARQHTMECDACAERLDAIESRPAPGKTLRFGRYVVLETLGEGGMGRVLRAFDTRLERPCALKLVLGNAPDAEARARLVREAQAMARVPHPNIVSVFDAGEDAGEVYVSMELVEGPTLADWLKARPRTWQEVVHHLRECALGLKAAHEAGLVHRDFKPQNVLLRDGVAKVTDFGLARVEGGVTLPVTPGAPRTSSQSTLTQAGTVLGTPAYMAPEQKRGQSDARSDQYALGVTLSEALHGHLPQDAGPERASVPGWLKRITHRLLEEAPERRFGSMGEVVDALDQGLARRRRRLRYGLAAAVVTVVAVSLVAERRLLSSTCQGFEARADTAFSGSDAAALRSAFGALPGGWAAATGDRLAAALSGAEAGWAKARTESCVAAKVKGETSDALYALESLCFERHLGRLGAVARAAKSYQWTDDEKKSREVAEALIAQLPVPADCQDASALTEQSGAESVEAQRLALPSLARIDDAIAQANIGASAEAMESMRVLAEELAGSTNGHLVALLKSVRGQFELRFGVEAKARGLLEEAWLGAYAAHDDPMALRVLFELVPLVARDKASLNTMMLMTRGFIDRMGSTPLRESERLNRAGLVQFGLADFTAAGSSFAEAVAITEKAEGSAAPRTLDLLHNLSAARAQEGRGEESVALQQRVLQGTAAYYGEKSIFTDQARGELGAQLTAARRDAEARPLLEQSLKALDLQPKPNVTTHYTVIDNLAFATLHLGDLATARALRDRLVDFSRERLPTDPRALIAYIWRAELELYAGEPAAARADVTTALSGLAAMHRDHPDVVFGRIFLAEATAAEGRLAEARQLAAQLKPAEADPADEEAAQKKLLVSCLERPSAAAKRAAEQAERFYAAKAERYPLELPLARHRLAEAMVPLAFDAPRCGYAPRKP